MRLHPYLAAKGMEAALAASRPPLSADDWRALAHLVASELWQADPAPAGIWPTEYRATLALWTDAPPARVLASLARLETLGIAEFRLAGNVLDVVWLAGAAKPSSAPARMPSTKEAS